MKAPRLRTRLLASHLLVTLATTMVLSFLFLSLGQRYFLDSLERSLTAQAQLVVHALIPEAGFRSPQQIAPAYNTMQQVQGFGLPVENQVTVQTSELEASNLALPDTFSLGFSPSVPTHIMLADRSGQIVFNTFPESTIAEYSLEDISSFLLGDTSPRIVSLDGADWFYIVQPFLINDQPAGWIELGQPLQDMQSVLADLRLRLLFSASIGLFAAAGTALLLAARISLPLRQLTKAARGLSSGDYRIPLQPGSRDEIGELVSSFESMRSRIETEQHIREQFVSNVSHELRTPLTAIKGLAETLQDGAVHDTDVRDRFLASIEHETDRLIRLTQDLLVLSRADAGVLHLNLQPLELTGLLAGCCTTFAAQALQAGIRVHCPPSPPVHALADADRIEQVLVILLDNAIKHTPSGGEITLRVQPADGAKMPGLPEPLPAGKWVVVRIEDSGTGIPQDALPHVFERFSWFTLPASLPV